MRIFPLLLTCLSATFVVAQDSGLRVHTQQGDVLGSLATPTVRRFLGIPYAAADRWEAPKLPPQRQDVFTADQFGDSCIQMNSSTGVGLSDIGGFVVPNVTESENCMTVNIWSPSIDRKQKTAVMIWIYGGGFQLGTVSRLSLDFFLLLLIQMTEQSSYLRWPIFRSGPRRCHNCDF
jgi:carboxylesterase type B